jgi:hypothetical protein
MSLGYDEEATILVSGSPRSGTTWLASSLSALPSSAVLFEPLQLEHVPAARRAGFRWRTFVPPGRAWPEGERFLRRVFSGRVLNGWTAREIAIPRRVETWIVKCVRTNRLLPWIAERFNFRRPLLIVRHPCAVVASQLNRSWPADVGEADTEHPFGDRVNDFVASLPTVEERLAAVWALDTLVPLSSPHPWPWEMLCFEHLVRGGLDVLSGVFSNWGLSTPTGIAERLSRLSSTADARTAGGDPVTSWRGRLSASQTRRILDVVRRLGIEIYDEDVMPKEPTAVSSPIL